MIQTFLAKPVTVTAIEWTGDNLEEIKKFTHGLAHWSSIRNQLAVETTEGTSWAIIGDWIVNGTQGEFYPVKARVMAEKYSKLDISESTRQ